MTDRDSIARRLATVLVLFLLLALPAGAQPVAPGAGPDPSGPETAAPVPSAAPAAVGSGADLDPEAAVAELRADERFGSRFVLDRAEFFPAERRNALEIRLADVAERTGRSIFVVTQAVTRFEGFGEYSRVVFREVFRKVDHSRFFLVLIGFDRRNGRGTVSVSLGERVVNVVGQAEHQSLIEHFVKPGETFTVDRAIAGIDHLVGLIEAYHRDQQAVSRRMDVEEGFFTRVKNWVFAHPLLIVGAVLLVLGALWLALRELYCPSCWAPLRTSVHIVFRPNQGGRRARKTYKCFHCGYVRQANLWPSFFGRATTTGAEPPRRRPSKG